MEKYICIKKSVYKSLITRSLPLYQKEIVNSFKKNLFRFWNRPQMTKNKMLNINKYMAFKLPVIS